MRIMSEKIVRGTGSPNVGLRIAGDVLWYAIYYLGTKLILSFSVDCWKLMIRSGSCAGGRESCLLMLEIILVSIEASLARKDST